MVLKCVQCKYTALAKARGRVVNGAQNGKLRQGWGTLSHLNFLNPDSSNLQKLYEIPQLKVTKSN